MQSRGFGGSSLESDELLSLQRLSRDEGEDLAPTLDAEQDPPVWWDLLRNRRRSPLSFRLRSRLHLDGMEGRASRGAERRAAAREAADLAPGESLDPNAGEFRGGTKVRRARLGFLGSFAEDWRLRFEVELSGGDLELRNTYVEWLDSQARGRVRLGLLREPFGLEAQTSTNEITFLERSLVSELTPGRNLGVSYQTPVDETQGVAAVGVFHETDDNGNSRGSSQGAVTARLTGSPWQDSANRVHWGLNYSLRRLPKDRTRFDARPESNLAPVLIDTGNVDDVRLQQMFMAEGAAVWNQWSLQGEYAVTSMSRDSGSHLRFQGYTLQLTRTLRGPGRSFRKNNAVFNSAHGGPWKERGASVWEAALRYSELDLSDDDVRGGRLKALTVGLNWSLSQELRWMANWVVFDLGSAGGGHLVQTRLQFRF